MVAAVEWELSAMIAWIEKVASQMEGGAWLQTTAVVLNNRTLHCTFAGVGLVCESGFTSSMLVGTE